MRSGGSSKSKSAPLRLGSTATLIFLEERLLLDLQTRRWSKAKMLIGTSGGDSTTRGPLKKPELDQIWLVDIHDRIRLFAGGSGKRFDSHWTAIELIDDRDENAAINIV